ncbi:glycoside hydrolase family protein [Streptacidiphilus rugosus]|uniref:hypothetical protein n=1 Tax=Streptacidiphilus rugosus TaxID=405783 RepID=UPI00056CDCDC|nr:hypothetical protein [Streptacidiphilus rugosus]
MKRTLFVLLMTMATLLGVGIGFGVSTATAAEPRSKHGTRSASEPGTAVAMPLLDLHDGMVARFGSTYYAYGTEYSCGFSWLSRPTPFCGFGVSTAPSLAGPWSSPTLLFDPRGTDPFTRLSWQQECGGTAQGCFNPRLIQRSGWGADDDAFLLWFNAPYDVSSGKSSNAYNVMGCNGPAGPCGPSAGAPHGSFHKPALNYCKANGDFGLIAAPAGPPAIVCSMGGAASLSVERLDRWGSNGSNSGSLHVAGLTSVEGAGGFWDEVSGTFVVTYGTPNCGYCSGTGTGFAIASSITGPYTAPSNYAAAAPPKLARALISGNSCGGQPRTVSVVDGEAYQGIDLWTGSRNETKAGWLLEPLDYTAQPNTPGPPWQPFAPWNCTP